MRARPRLDISPVDIINEEQQIVRWSVVDPKPRVHWHARNVLNDGQALGLALKVEHGRRHTEHCLAGALRAQDLRRSLFVDRR